MMINRATKEMTVKIVYYGPGLCGKTTNLEYIYEKAVPEKKGKLLTVATETDRTLFFDFLPMELGQIRGMKLRVQLYTVPGQVFYDATRRIVLRGSDGVVFVADSQAAMMEANLESLNNLKKNLQLNNLDPESVPLVFQYNKQDLQGLAATADLEATLNWRKVPSFAAVATVGTGVNETLKKIIELVVRRAHEQEAVLKAAQKMMVTGEAPAPEEASAPAPAPPAPAPAPPAAPPRPAPPPVPVTAPPSAVVELPAPPEPEPAAAETQALETVEELPVPVELPAEAPPEPAPAMEELPVEVEEAPTAAAVPLEPERDFSTNLSILAEALEELEKKAAAMAQEIHELRAQVEAMRR